jgi:hypothetical protein
MDKFMIDPPDNITIEQLQPEKIETAIEPIRGPPSSPSSPSFSQSSPPVVIKESISPPSNEGLPQSLPDGPSDTGSRLNETVKSLTPTFDDLPTKLPEVNPKVETAFVQPVETVETTKYSWRTWLIFVLTLFVFVIFAIYYAAKFILNESKYIIKKNAKTYKVSFDEIKEDVKTFLRTRIESIQEWNEDLYSKINQFFFRQHVENGVFKVTKYKIPKWRLPIASTKKKANENISPKQKPDK